MNYRGLTLDPFQEQAIEHMQNGESVLVAAPTGTGKTIIADWIVEEALRTGKRVIYTAPIKALSNQKFRDYTRLHGEEHVGLVTGDLVIRREAPCLVMTTEILRNMLLGGDSLDDLLAVVIDEIHFLADRERGTVWEEVLIYLPHTVQIVGLSATLSNLNDFADWLTDVRGREVPVVRENTRHVPLRLLAGNIKTGLMPLETFEKAYQEHRKSEQSRGFDDRDGGQRGDRRKGRKGRDNNRRKRFAKQTRHGHIFEMLFERDLFPYLYFAFSRRDTENYARHLSHNIGHELLTVQEGATLDERLRQAKRELGGVLDRELLRMYSQGVAFHHAGLHVQLKALVEDLYENRLIKILYCTSTFALGINMPARSVVFDGLRIYDGKSFDFLSVRQFMQVAGRAGRRGMDEVGHVVLRMDFEEYEEARPHLNRYRAGDSEPVMSTFNLSWNSVINLLQEHDEEHCRDIVEKSFLNWSMAAMADKQLAKADALENKPGPRRQVKEARRLRRRAEKAGDRCWADFEQRVRVLRSAGYLGNENEFNAGAKILRHLQIAEVLVTELVLDGLLDELEPDTLFGVLCGLVATFPRKAWRNFNISRDDKQLDRAIETIRASPPVAMAAHLTEQEAEWSANYVPLGREWARGKPFDFILGMVESDTDISGDLVSAFRRAKDLAGQLRNVYDDIPDRKAMLARLIREVSRDEVEVVG